MSSMIPACGATALSLDEQLLRSVKLPNISKLTILAEQWSPNIDNLKKKLKSFFDAQPTQIEDTNLETSDIIRNNNYPGDTYEIITADEYILTLFRITHGRDQTASTTKRPPALLVHGLLTCSDDWVKLGAQNALGFILADHGYDVWLGNCRGTRYSNKHALYKTEHRKFWDYTLHEMALYDISSMIDFILNETDQPKLYYIGYGQGTTLFYILCSENPEYNKKIEVNVGLAPIVFAHHVQCPVIKIIEHLEQKNVLRAFFPETVYELRDEVRRKSSKFIDCKNTNNDILCLNDLFVTFGYNPNNISPSILPLLLNEGTENQASMNQFIHYSQLTASGNFCRFDYKNKNRIKYEGSEKPPKYNLSNITCPSILFISKNDWVSRVQDVAKLKLKLTNASVLFVEIDRGERTPYTHMDYLYGMDVVKRVYLRILQELSKHDLESSESNAENV